MKPKASRLLAASQIAFCLTALPAMAVVYDWDNGSTDGLWDTNTNWNPDGLPTTGDNVLVTVDSAAIKTINLSATPTNPTILEVGLARSGNGTATVDHTGGTLTVTGWFNLGQGFVASAGGSGGLSGTGIWNMSGNAVVNATHASGGQTTIGAGWTAAGYNTGILNISGNATFNQSVADVYIGGENGTRRAKGIVNISDNGKLLNATRDIYAGVAGNGSVGALNLSGTSQVTSRHLYIGIAPDSYGAVNAAGGSLTLSGDMNIGSWGTGYQTNGGNGLMNVSAGTVAVGGWLCMSRWGTSQTSVLNVSGGSLTYAGGGLQANWNADGADTSVITVSGSGSISTTNNTVINLSNNGAAANNGFLNLNGGTVTPGRVIGGRGFVNFNGGTLRANSNQADFLAVNTAQVRAGGAIIDSNSRNITIGQALLAPSDDGVTSIPVTDGGSGYVSAPILTISGGTGSGATAVANMISDGAGALKIDSVTVTSRGNYTVAPTTITQIGGGASVSATFGTIATAANSSGGLTKNGAGILTLSNASTYTGPTQVNAGGLIVNGSLASSITLAADADLGGAGLTSGSLTFAPGTHKLFFNPAATSSFLADSITTTGATITVVPDGVFAPVTNKVILESSSGPINGSIANFVSGNPRLSLAFDVTGEQLLASYAPAPLVWTGSNGTNPTFWDTTTVNWANPAADVFIPGDNTTFDDTAVAASPVQVAIQSPVLPGAVTFGNTAKEYVVSGAAITGTTGLMVNGGGRVTLANANTYTGLTTVRSGTLAVTGSIVAGSDLRVADAAGNAVLQNSGAITRTTAWFGSVNGAVGAGYQTAGSLTTILNGGNSLGLGVVQGSHGYFNISGGTVNTTEISIGTWGLASGNNNGGDGMLDITGGTVTNNGWMVMNRSEGGGAVAQRSVLNVSGGSLTYAGGGLVANWGGSANVQTAQINVSGSGSVATIAGSPINLSWNGNINNTGTLNLNGGTVTPSDIRGGRGFVNFNGGTLRPSADNTNFIAVNTARVYAGGANIDTNTRNITIGQALLAPTGNGVNATGLAITGGSGYIAPPFVQITGDGTGATAIATITGGAVTGITITNPGMGYTSVPTFTLSGGGGTGASVAAGTATTVPNVSGGLTKNGLGTLTLSASNTYTGNTTVTGGVLAITQPYLADTSSVSIAATAQMALNFTGDDTVTSVTLGGTTYTAPGSYNATTFPTFFTGTGSLVIPSSGTPYDSWLTAYPSITGANRSPDADPDSDGVANGIEFMLGTSPADGASRAVPSITRDGSGNLVVSFTRVDAAEAFPVIVESSPNLQPPWTAVTVPNDAIAGPPITVVDNGTAPDSITVIVPGAPDPRKFARVKITIPFTP
jgi:fibronectin-binding autotransporter adhesin